MFIEKLQTPLTADNAIIQLGDIDDSQKGRQFKSRFIQAGIAGYPKQFGNVLITKETLDKFVNTLVDKPVIINHKDEIKPEDEVGKVTKVWFNSEDGWFWCEGYLTDETAINLIKDKGWSVSCSYDVLLLDDEGGTENNIKYDKEFLNGRFTHLAIVENPRYERANIVVNSKTEVISKAENDKWITVHPNGEDEKGRHLLIQDGEDLKEAMQRQWGVYDKRQAKLKSDDKGKKLSNKEVHEKLNDLRTKMRKYALAGDRTNEEYKQLKAEYQKTLDEWDISQPNEDIKETEQKVEKSDDKDKDLYSDENFKYNAKRLNEQFGEKPYSEWQKDVQTMLKKYGKTEEDWDNAVGARKDAFDPEKSDSKPSKEFFDSLEKQHKEMQKKAEENEKAKLLDKDRLQKYKETYEKNKKYIREHELSDVEREVAKQKQDKILAEIQKMEEAQKSETEPKQEEKPESKTKTIIDEKEEAYKKAWQEYRENEKNIRKSELFSPDFMKYANKHRVAALKKAITDSRREYAESIMANFEEQDNSAYTNKVDARRERFLGLSEQAQKASDAAHKRFSDMALAMPFGQPNVSARTISYRKKEGRAFDAAIREGKKADYYAGKAASVGTAGISADDANAIAKLAQKYKSGVSSAEKRRIIDRVIDIHRNRQATSDTSKQTDYSDLGFQVERNADMNRLQLKFNGKPDEKTRSILKSNGFRWSPTQGAWQRQLNGNSEYGLKRVVEGLKKVDNSLTKGIYKIFNTYVPSIDDIPLLQGLIDIFENKEQ